MNKPHLSNKILSIGLYKLLNTKNKSSYTKYFYNFSDETLENTIETFMGLGVPHVNDLLDYLSTL